MLSHIHECLLSSSYMLYWTFHATQLQSMTQHSVGSLLLFDHVQLHCLLLVVLENVVCFLLLLIAKCTTVASLPQIIHANGFSLCRSYSRNFPYLPYLPFLSRPFPLLPPTQNPTDPHFLQPNTLICPLVLLVSHASSIRAISPIFLSYLHSLLYPSYLILLLRLSPNAHLHIAAEIFGFLAAATGCVHGFIVSILYLYSIVLKKTHAEYIVFGVGSSVFLKNFIVTLMRR